MNFLQLWHLNRFCDKHGVDYAEIDSQISYTANKSHLMSLVPKDLEDLLASAESQLADYMKNNFLTYYVTCIQDGTTKSEEVGDPIPSTRFSLSEWINR